MAAILARVAHDTVGPLSGARAALTHGDSEAAAATLAEVTERLEVLGRLRTPVRAWIDLRAEMDRVGANLSAARAWSAISFVFTCNTQHEWWGDPLLVRRAMYELVLNAAAACTDFTGHREVNVTASEHDDLIRIEVSQTTPLPSPQQVARLLAPDFSSTRRASGFGLGIPLVLAIARAHGGFLTVHGDPAAFLFAAPQRDVSSD
jgi:signal transduction histidine kinase